MSSREDHDLVQLTWYDGCYIVDACGRRADATRDAHPREAVARCRDRGISRN